MASIAVRPAARTAPTLLIAASATLLVLATFSAIATTLPDTARDLHAGPGGQTWALSGMSLGLATALLSVGALADDLGRRRVLAGSTAALAATSALGALAPGIGVLIAARVLQGVAGAGVVAASLAVIGHAFPSGHRRTHATGVWAAAVGGGIALGPAVAAALASPLGWRSTYWIEAAAAAALLPATLTLHESRAGTARPVDVPGVVTLAAGMAALTAGLVEGRTSWSAPGTLALLGAGAVLVATFALVELAQDSPMLDLRLFAEPRFVASITGALFTGLAVIGLMSWSATVYQRVLGVSVLGSAGVLAIWSATSMAVALGARRLPARLSSQARLAIGLALCAAGEVALTGLSAGSAWTRVAPGLVVAGVGSGIANAALGRLAVESVPAERAGMGSGANNTARYLGGAAGVALVIAVGSNGGAGGLAHGWDDAALASAALCATGAAIALATLLPRSTRTRTSPQR